jgi:hypothetical protein
MEKVLASHNSFTYTGVRRFWMAPFVWAARCQDRDIDEQWRAGVRIFDMRLRFDSAWSYYICHGMISFNADVDALLRRMECYAKTDGCSCRVWLEEYRKYDPSQESLFIQFCRRIEEEYPHVRFFGGCRKFDGKMIYDFRTNVPLLGKYSSVTSLFRNDNKFLRVIDDLWPRFYAMRKNRENVCMYAGNTWPVQADRDLQTMGAVLHIDFIDEYY